MLNDIVVDTDVLAHADNPASGRQDAALGFVAAMRKCTTALCLDDNFTGDEDSKSAIASEYLRQLAPGGVGLTLVLELAQTERVKVVSRKVVRAKADAIRQCIGDKSDRKFAQVAANSQSRVLVSHDRGFHARKADLKRRIAVDVLDADQGGTRLRDH